MYWLTPAAIAAILLAIGGVIFSLTHLQLQGLGSAPSASSTAVIVATTTEARAETPKEAAEPADVPTPAPEPAQAVASAPQTDTAPAQTQSVTAASEPFEHNPDWLGAEVNLICTNRYATVGGLSSGSGTIIDSRGVILTNAHVATEFIFADWPTPSWYDCAVRIGSPARSTYRAKILYIPKSYVDSWLDDTISNAKTAPASADDTYVYGNKDYALLVITGRTNPAASLPGSFPHLPVNDGPAPEINEFVYIQGYPAEYLGETMAQLNLYSLTTTAHLSGRSALGGGVGADVLAFSKSIASQHGASGGAVINRQGAITGMLTFLNKDYGYETDKRVINAITTSYINADMKKDTGMTLDEFLARGDPRTLVKDYQEEMLLPLALHIAQRFKDELHLDIPGSGL